MKGTFPIEKWGNLTTPFYFYDTTLLKNTLEAIKKETDKYNFCQHYAIKANANSLTKYICENKQATAITASAITKINELDNAFLFALL
mgnify:CR=1 FL=1